MRRRDLIKTLGVLPAAGHVLADGGGPVPGGDTGVPAARATFTADQWLTIAAVQDHLLPSEPADAAGGPGAREVRATDYLDRTLAVPGFDVEVREFILRGIGWLDDLAAERHTTRFAILAPGTREDLLREIAATGPGERWLSSLITYTLEALLADPLYGGNPGGVGWTWLGHDPGLPRPTAATIHGRLGRG